MTETFIQPSEDEFDEGYSLVPNHINPSASWAVGDGPGCLFETYGEEMAFIRAQDPRRIWTLVDGDNGGLYLVSGYHLVNRIGYLLTQAFIPEDTFIEVELEVPHETG